MVNKPNYLNYVLVMATIVSILIVSYNTLIKKKIDVINTEEVTEEILLSDGLEEEL